MISEETRSRISEEMAKFPRPRGALLAALHMVHADHGHVSRDCAAELAELFGIRAIDVLEVVSFYNMFHATPQPRHHVHVCTNLPCSLRGARTLMRQLEAHVGVRAGEPTPDGRLVIDHEECLGACAYAPMMRIDGEYHEDLDAERAKSILDSLE